MPEDEASSTFFNLLKDRKVASDPNLVTFEDMFTHGPGQLPSAFGIVAAMPLLTR